MEKDEKAMKLRSVYMELDENKREKMELLAVNLLNAQKVVVSERHPWRQPSVLNETKER